MRVTPSGNLANWLLLFIQPVDVLSLSIAKSFHVTYCHFLWRSIATRTLFEADWPVRYWSHVELKKWLWHSVSLLVTHSVHNALIMLTHWGRVTHICVGKQTILGLDNGLSPGRRQAIIWTNAAILSSGPLDPSKFKHFHSWKWFWKCRLRNGGHFVSTSMC